MMDNQSVADAKLFNQVVEIMKTFHLTMSDYEKFCNKMNEAVECGLDPNTRHKSSIKMYPTYVEKIPNGTESGDFLALDLGGTNYRVLFVRLTGKGKRPEINDRTYSIPIQKMTGSGEELFTYIAETLRSYLQIHELMDRKFKLGFTFSFPCDQHGLTNAVLVRWTKGFSVSGVEGKNVAELLQKAIDKLKLNVECVAVVNDTVGTLASCALVDPKCAMGVIVGTGTNAAYVDSGRSGRGLQEGDESEMVVNTEWGAFGENGELDEWRTQFDEAVDKESQHPGKHLFEKMVSGMYLGELCRHIILYLVQQNLLFRGLIPEKLTHKESLLTRYLTDVERDPPHLLYNTHYMLTEDLFVPEVEPIDDKIVRYVCETVCKRAAYLVGAAIACLLRRMKRSEVTIGVDGSLFRFHPKFSERMTDMADQLKPPNTKFCLRLSEDGSGKGAAAIAAACERS